jgi:tetratricopeptide (TPR) repeat protein
VALYTALKGRGLVGVGQLRDASSALLAASELYRKLASTDSELSHRNLASTLNNLGTLRWELREFGLAGATLREALNIKRDLAKRWPRVYEADLASTFLNFGNVLRDVQQQQEAYDSYDEALQIYRKLQQSLQTMDSSRLRLTTWGLYSATCKNWNGRALSFRKHSPFVEILLNPNRRCTTRMWTASRVPSMARAPAGGPPPVKSLAPIGS